jgi:hypothetical protein
MCKFEYHSVDLFEHAFAIFDIGVQEVLRAANSIGLATSVTFRR